MQAPSPNVMPQTHLTQVLNYLKQGHQVLPPQPIRVPQFQTPIMGQGGHLPLTGPM